MNIIKTEKLTKNYGKNRGITELALSVGEGDFFGFIGPNGAGKSTTIRTLLGLIKPTSGSAEIFGLDISSAAGRKEILSRTGYMPSEAYFYSGMTADDMIRFSAKTRRKDCSAEAGRLCERLGVDRKKKIEELSLGNRKKVSVVCALQHQPELCILDEPTSGLDPLMQKEFFDILRERHAAGATIFLSSHILSEIQKNCTRAAIIKEGRLIALDSVENLSRTNARRVTLHGVSTVPGGIEALSPETLDGSVSFLYSGSAAKLISALNDLPITDITITEPDLEEIFMHYYEKGGEGK